MKDSPMMATPFAPGFAIRLPIAIDVVPLLAEVEALGSGPWRIHFNTGYHDGGWSGFALQSAHGEADTLYIAPPGSAAGESARPTQLASLCPELMRVVASFQCEVKSARVLRLAAGATIREHNDADLVWADGEARLHIPLATNPDVAFYVDDQRVRMLAGECWYLNLSKPHRVQNRGGSDRLHLVLDCAVNGWLTQQVVCGTPPTKESTQTMDDATARFEGFRDTVFADAALRDELHRCKQMDEFMALTVALGAERGFQFTAEDVRAVVNRARRDWMEQWIV